MPGPLNGYRIVDLTSNVSGPLATMILADQGAEVIKVEAPNGGDSTRSGANRRGGFTAGFLNNNRNKRSIVLDLKNPAALRAFPPENPGGARCVEAARGGRRCFGANFSPRCRRPDRGRRDRDPHRRA